jgi:hypothetical protein
MLNLFASTRQNATIFDQNDIAFLYDPEGDSRFSKFVAKESASS